MQGVAKALGAPGLTPSLRQGQQWQVRSRILGYWGSLYVVDVVVVHLACHPTILMAAKSLHGADSITCLSAAAGACVTLSHSHCTHATQHTSAPLRPSLPLVTLLLLLLLLCHNSC